MVDLDKIYVQNEESSEERIKYIQKLRSCLINGGKVSDEELKKSIDFMRKEREKSPKGKVAKAKKVPPKQLTLDDF